MKMIIGLMVLSSLVYGGSCKILDEELIKTIQKTPRNNYEDVAMKLNAINLANIIINRCGGSELAKKIVVVYKSENDKIKHLF